MIGQKWEHLGSASTLLLTRHLILDILWIFSHVALFTFLKWGCWFSAPNTPLSLKSFFSHALSLKVCLSTHLSRHRLFLLVGSRSGNHLMALWNSTFYLYWHFLMCISICLGTICENLQEREGLNFSFSLKWRLFFSSYGSKWFEANCWLAILRAQKGQDSVFKNNEGLTNSYLKGHGGKSLFFPLVLDTTWGISSCISQ